MKLRAWILAAMLPAVAGWLWTPELSEIQREIERQLPGARFEKDVRISLGPLSLGLARFATGFIPEGVAPEAREAHDYLQEVRRVQVALYRTLELPALQDVRLPQHLKDRIRDEGWHLAVKKQQPTELVWVLTQEEQGLVRDIYVILLNSDNLVLVRVQGLRPPLESRLINPELELARRL
jgi:hypothetical protein